MKLMCAGCRREIEGNVYSNKAVKSPQEATKNFHELCFRRWFQQEQLKRMMEAGSFNAA